MFDLSEAIRDHGRIHTPWSGPVAMLDGVNYYGNVWRLDAQHPSTKRVLVRPEDSRDKLLAYKRKGA